MTLAISGDFFNFGVYLGKEAWDVERNVRFELYVENVILALGNHSGKLRIDSNHDEDAEFKFRALEFISLFVAEIFDF